MPISDLDKLKQMTAWTAEPALSEDDLAAALGVAARVDANGFGPIDEEWQPTYDLNAAASHAWLTKAARAAGTTEGDPATGIVTSRVFDNCRAMARIFAAKRSGTISTR